MNKCHKDYWNSDKVTNNGYLSYNTLNKFESLKRDNLITQQLKKLKQIKKKNLIQGSFLSDKYLVGND